MSGLMYAPQNAGATWQWHDSLGSPLFGHNLLELYKALFYTPNITYPFKVGKTHPTKSPPHS